MNRLKLDFSLSTTDERNSFLHKYLKENETMFAKRPLTTEETETMANYILWGKDPKTGLNVKQTKEIELETRNKTWDVHPEESLDALLETPGFAETMIKYMNEPRTKIPKVIFSRDEARKNADPLVLKQLEELWQQIDKIDLILNFYDMRTGKRKNPPRAELLKRFNEKEIQHIKKKSESLTQYKYLKLRHLLVELRREQFTLRDTYITPIICNELVQTPAVLSLNLDSDVLCAPIGLKYKDDFILKLFPANRFPIPSDFNELELKQLVNFYWNKKKELENFKNFDFRELEHIYQALLLFYDLEDDALDAMITSASTEFLDTLNFYIDRAYLNDIHKDILKLKMKHVKNQEIVNKIKDKYGKSYTANYISTIFRQKIIPQINKAARQHAEIIENLCFPENWKKCKTCSEVLLINADNFVRKSNSSDGFSNQCKRCDKKIRQQRKRR